jgi:hypothetical protein
MPAVGSASHVVAYARAGARWAALAQAFEMPIREIGDMIEAAAITDLRSREIVTGFPLISSDLRHCSVLACGRPRTYRRWCPTHYTRLIRGIEMLLPVGRRATEVSYCAACGASWCLLDPARRTTTCGSPECVRERLRVGVRTRERRRSARPSPNAVRDAAILKRLRRGEVIAAIAADHGLSTARVNQIANRAGLYRRPPLDDVQRAARHRHVTKLS